MIMAGGTGGHIFPGLAVARFLHARRVSIAWLGTPQGLEARLVPAAGLDIQMEWIHMRGVRGTGWLRWLLLPFTLTYAVLQAFAAWRRTRPKAVLSMGGFVAAPGGIVAWLTRTPLLVHEANAIPGLTNRWLALVASQVLTGFPDTFARFVTAQHVGNPVRREIAALPAPAERLAGRRGLLRLLVVGGSRGAQVLNEIVPRAVAELPAGMRPLIRHQCGGGALADTTRRYDEVAVSAEVTEFIDDMATAYAWAVLVLCRAGAMTIAELAAGGCAAILVPYPYAVDDHQSANARFLADRGAAVCVPQAEFNAARLAELLRDVHADRAVITRMAEAARGTAMTDAAETVARLCMEAAA